MQHAPDARSWNSACSKPTPSDEGSTIDAASSKWAAAETIERVNSSFAFASRAPTVLQTTPASEHAQPDRASSTTVRKLTATSIISPIRRGESSSISLHVQPPRTSESSWLGPIVDEVAPGSPREISLGYNNAVTWFSARNVSMARVPVRSDVIWELITDPDTLASLTPLVASIDVGGL